MYTPKLEKDIRCPLEYALDFFGGKWKSRVICALAQNPHMRYSALRNELCNITDTMLAATLKELEAGGMVIRTQYNEIPPKVEYDLTEKGASTIPLLFHICKWGVRNSEDFEGGLCPNCHAAELKLHTIKKSSS
jgi:DNA-binding HxlR family transcriptional regulator